MYKNKLNILISIPYKVNLDSSEFDRELNGQNINGKLTISDLNLTKAGRWQIKAKIIVDENKTGFYQVELYAK